MNDITGVKVWTVQQVSDNGAWEIQVFSSRAKVYDFLYQELESARDREKEGRPEFVESFDRKFETYVNALNEAFDHDYITFSVDCFYWWWDIQETKII